MEDKHKLLIDELRRSFIKNCREKPTDGDPTENNQEGNDRKRMSSSLGPGKALGSEPRAARMGPQILVEGFKVPLLTQAPSNAASQKMRKHSWEVGDSELFESRSQSSPFKRDSLRRRSTTSLIKKIKDKVQDKLKTGSDSTEFKTYLAPEINIAEDEHRKALENFRLFTRHNQILESGPHSKASTYAAYDFWIDRYSVKKRAHRLGDFDHLTSDPLEVFDGHLQLRICPNETTHVAGVVHFLSRMTVQLQPTDKGLPSRAISLQDLPLSYFYHRRTILVGTRVAFVDEPPFGERWARQWLTEEYCRPLDVAHSLVEKDLRDDRLSIRLVFEPFLPLIKSYVSNDGVLDWDIERFSEKLEAERTGVARCQYSPYFYSDPRGYRMRLRLYLNGAGVARGTHLSVFLDFLVGEWDDSLPPLERFPHRTTFVILNQSESTEERKPIVAAETNKDGHPTDFFYDFVHQSLIKEDLYLRDDVLRVRVVVEPIHESIPL